MKLFEIADPSKNEADRLLDQALRRLDVFHDYAGLNERAKKALLETIRLIDEARAKLQK